MIGVVKPGLFPYPLKKSYYAPRKKPFGCCFHFLPHIKVLTFWVAYSVIGKQAKDWGGICIFSV